MLIGVETGLSCASIRPVVWVMNCVACAPPQQQQQQAAQFTAAQIRAALPSQEAPPPRPQTSEEREAHEQRELEEALHRSRLEAAAEGEQLLREEESWSSAFV